jgi:hypothetical protein
MSFAGIHTIHMRTHMNRMSVRTALPARRQTRRRLVGRDCDYHETVIINYELRITNYELRQVVL